MLVGTVYALKLVEGKLYVGVTNHLGRRLAQHADGSFRAGAEWTRRYVRDLPCGALITHRR
jgi:predicted GIY-YIG superfamily endonuclease